MLVSMPKAANVVVERIRQRMLALKMHEPSPQYVALRFGHRSTRLTSIYQFRAAQLLRLAEEKGVKTLGNTWYVNVFSLCFIEHPRDLLSKSGESHQAHDAIRNTTRGS